MSGIVADFRFGFATDGTGSVCLIGAIVGLAATGPGVFIGEGEGVSELAVNAFVSAEFDTSICKDRLLLEACFPSRVADEPDPPRAAFMRLNDNAIAEFGKGAEDEPSRFGKSFSDGASGGVSAH